MQNVIKILENESNSTRSDLIHIYREKDKWYAYERSAFLLSELMKGQIVLNQFVIDQIIWLARAEVDIQQIPYEYVIYYDHNEYVLCYLPETSFYNWISNLTKIQ